MPSIYMRSTSLSQPTLHENTWKTKAVLLKQFVGSPGTFYLPQTLRHVRRYIISNLEGTK